jgi:hypothetical protein
MDETISGEKDQESAANSESTGAVSAEPPRVTAGGALRLFPVTRGASEGGDR